jgi:hypothetical protein
MNSRAGSRTDLAGPPISPRAPFRITGAIHEWEKDEGDTPDPPGGLDSPIPNGFLQSE